MTITARKVSARQRRHFAEKRGGGQIAGESVFVDLNGKNLGMANVLGTEPTPELVAEMLKEISELKFQGYSNQKIAVHIGKNIRTVERKLGRTRETWGDLNRDVTE